MGLDITAYSGLREMPKDTIECDEDGYPVDYRTYSRFYDNTDFPGRSAGIICNKETYYAHLGEFKFRAGSYSGYNHWRTQLAALVAGCDKGPIAATLPFAELINFSDCEGVLGPVVCKKLAADFAAYQQKADEFSGADGDWFRERYADWRKAFELAEQGGCVEFH